MMAAGVLAGCAESAPDADVTTASEDTVTAAQTEADKDNAVQTAAPSPNDPGLEKGEIMLGTPSGFYSGGITLEIFCGEGGVIHYTTDGSTPDESSPVYTKPLNFIAKTDTPNVLSAVQGTSAASGYLPSNNVKKANIIRAFAVYPDGTRSEEVNGSYWIGIDRKKKYGDLPVISLMTDMDNLFDYEKGIYIMGKTYDEYVESMAGKHFEHWEAKANYTNRGKEWERPVSVQFLAPDGTVGFDQIMGMRIMGAASRSAPQKSMRLIARDEYGKKSVGYEIIPDNLRSDGEGNVEKYKSFVLRNGGNDCDYAKVRDPLFQELVSDRRFETMQYTPCVVYLDGEYWGMYTITEDYSDNYIENNYGIESDNVVIIKRGEIEEGEEADIGLYNEMYDFITGNNMEDPDNYAKAAEMFDIEGFADYCAFNLYIYNEDSFFKDNNWRMWRVRTADGSAPQADGKWRMMVYDTDYSAGIYNGGSNYKDDNITPSVNNVNRKEDAEDYRDPAEIFRSLFANEDFRHEFVNAMCDIRNFNFNSTDSINRLVELNDIYSIVVPATFRRFGPDWIAYQDTDAYYQYKIRELANFLDGRYGRFPSIMQRALALGDICSAEFRVSDNDLGGMRVNITELDLGAGNKISGKYFAGNDIQVSAVEKIGNFVRWEYEGCTLSDDTSPTATVSFTGDFSITAVYEYAER